MYIVHVYEKDAKFFVSGFTGFFKYFSLVCTEFRPGKLKITIKTTPTSHLVTIDTISKPSQKKK